MSAQLQRFHAFEAYLAVEREGTTRHEYVAGTIYAMAGGSEQHNLIVGNAYAALQAQLRRRQCTIYPSDMKVAILRYRIMPTLILASCVAKHNSWMQSAIYCLIQRS